jgi:hypothetical protein
MTDSPWARFCVLDDIIPADLVDMVREEVRSPPPQPLRFVSSRPPRRLRGWTRT